MRYMILKKLNELPDEQNPLDPINEIPLLPLYEDMAGTTERIFRTG